MNLQVYFNITGKDLNLLLLSNFRYNGAYLDKDQLYPPTTTQPCCDALFGMSEFEPWSSRTWWNSYSLVASTESSPVADQFYKTSTLFLLPFKLKIIKLNFHYLYIICTFKYILLGFIVDLVIFLSCIKSIHVHALFTNRASFWITESGRSVYCELLQNFFPQKILSVERYVIADYFYIKQMNVTW